MCIGFRLSSKVLLGLCLCASAFAGQAADPGTAVGPVPAVPPTLTEDLSAWRQRIRDKIREQFVFPLQVPNDAQVELEVSLLPSGNAADVSTRKTSGFPELDAAARRAVLAATPLPVPGDAASYERVRRFGVIFQARTGLQMIDPQAHAPPQPAPAAAASERFVCTAASAGPALSPDCSQSGSRSELLTCFAQAVQRRAAKIVSVCGVAAYPAEARKNRWEGTVQVGVSFDRGGRSAGVTVAEGSGQALLDQRALDIVQEALLPPPPELYATPFAVRVPMVFRMQRPATMQIKPAAREP